MKKYGNLGETIFYIGKEGIALNQIIIDNIDKELIIQLGFIETRLFLLIDKSNINIYISDQLNISEDYISTYNSYISIFKRTYKINKLIS